MDQIECTACSSHSGPCIPWWKSLPEKIAWLKRSCLTLARKAHRMLQENQIPSPLQRLPKPDPLPRPPNRQRWLEWICGVVCQLFFRVLRNFASAVRKSLLFDPRFAFVFRNGFIKHTEVQMLLMPFSASMFRRGAQVQALLCCWARGSKNVVGARGSKNKP